MKIYGLVGINSRKHLWFCHYPASNTCQLVSQITSPVWRTTVHWLNWQCQKKRPRLKNASNQCVSASRGDHLMGFTRWALVFAPGDFLLSLRWSRFKLGKCQYQNWAFNSLLLMSILICPASLLIRTCIASKAFTSLMMPAFKEV